MRLYFYPTFPMDPNSERARWVCRCCHYETYGRSNLFTLPEANCFIVPPLAGLPAMTFGSGNHIPDESDRFSNFKITQGLKDFAYPSELIV